MTGILALKPSDAGIIIPGPHIDQPGLGIADVAQAADEPLAAGAAFGTACEAVLAIPGVCSSCAGQRVAVGVAGDGAGSGARQAGEAVGGIVDAAGSTGAAVCLGQAVAHGVEAVALGLTVYRVNFYGLHSHKNDMIVKAPLLLSAWDSIAMFLVIR